MQVEFIDPIPSQRRLVHWLDHDARDLQVLGIFQRFVDPGFHH